MTNAQNIAAQANAHVNGNGDMQATDDLIKGLTEDVSKSQVMANCSILAKRALLVYPNLRAWGGQVKDRQATKEYNEKKGVIDKEHKSAVVTKLLPKMARKLTNAVTSIRNRSNELTLRYEEKNWHLLPAGIYWQYMEEMRRKKTEFYALLDEELDHYAEYMAEERRKKGATFHPELYPSREEIRGSYEVNFYFKPVPDSGSWIVDIEKEEMGKLQTVIAAEQSAALEQAMREAWQRAYERVNHMCDRLKHYGEPTESGKRIQTFRDSMIENMQELVEFLPAFNLTDDPQLDAIYQKIRDRLLNYDAHTLREDDAARSDTLQEAQDILAMMKGFTG